MSQSDQVESVRCQDFPLDSYMGVSLASLGSVNWGILAYYILGYLLKLCSQKQLNKNQKLGAEENHID